MIRRVLQSGVTLALALLAWVADTGTLVYSSGHVEALGALSIPLIGGSLTLFASLTALLAKVVSACANVHRETGSSFCRAFWSAVHDVSSSDHGPSA